MQTITSVQQPCSNPSESPERLRHAPTHKYGDFQQFCKFWKRLGNYLGALAWRRSRVRVSSGPLPFCGDLQVKRGRREKVSDTLRSLCAATVQQRGGEPINVTVLRERNHSAKQKDTQLRIAIRYVSETLVYSSFWLRYIMFHSHVFMAKAANRIIDLLSTVAQIHVSRRNIEPHPPTHPSDFRRRQCSA
jgi:hypothetical protein